MSNKNLIINLKNRKRNPYFNLTTGSPPKSRATLGRLRFNLRDAALKLNAYYRQFNLELHIVHLREINTDLEPFELKVTKQVDIAEPEKFDSLDAVKIKDIANTSEENYTKIRKISSRFPSLYKIRKMTSSLNNIFKVHQNEFGFYNNVNEKLNIILRSYLKKFKEKSNLITESCFENNVIKLKFCTDGFQTTRTKRQILNFSFSILHSQTKPHSSDGHYILGWYLDNLLYLKLSFKLGFNLYIRCV